MPRCRGCKEEYDRSEMVPVRWKGRTVRMCHDCADELAEREEIMAESERVVRGMMEFRGKR